MGSAMLMVVLFGMVSSVVFASDPGPLQDFCVADKASQVLVNGFVCKNPMKVDADDFFFSGLNKPGNTNNKVGSNVTTGTLHVGFVTSNPENRLIFKVLNAGDVFVFPVGLIHFQFNPGHENAVAIAALSSQNPGVITIANAVFGSNPKIDDGILAKAFQVDKKVIDYLQNQFWEDNNN
ncbi:Germin-like protein 8-2 [Acorus gramineus]|uniref:Germin-like protein n=1 Tax=Acorus gramineus TaxID=55184 RepID=A0AAV9BRJ5_ACOGR|nr:Germin-like protein 8-2 [Acorus gramineus]